MNKKRAIFVQLKYFQIKKVIAESYNFTLLKLIEKIKVEAKSVLLTTNMWTARNE